MNPKNAGRSLFRSSILNFRYMPFSTLLCTILLVTASNAFAVDTVEHFDRGLSDLEFYTGYDGLNSDAADSTIFGELMVGFGVLDNLSFYGGTVLSGNGKLAAGGVDFCLGTFYTPLDTTHMDLDLLLDFSAGIAEATPLMISPGFEVNIDFAPDMSFMGFWLTGGLSVYGIEYAAGPPVVEDDGVRYNTDIDLPFAVGYYITFAKSHQLLLGMDFSVIAVDSKHRRDFEVGSLGLGYNVALADNLELISEVSLNIPQEDEKIDMGFSIGFIGGI